MSEQERILYLDSARSVLMMLGVVLHSSNVYQVSGDWIVSDPDQHLIFNYLTDFIHAFRMPAFFLISGFFCALTLRRYGSLGFLKRRIPRIVVPLVAVALIVNLPQTALTNSMGITNRDLSLTGILGSRSIVYHLWFLINIAIYFVVAAIVYPVLFRNSHRLGASLRMAARKSHPFIIVSVMTLSAVGSFLAVVAAAKIWPSLYDGIGFLGSIFSLLYFSIFFCLGMVLWESPSLRGAFFSRGWIIWSAAAAAFLLLRTVDPNSLGGRVLDATLVMTGTLAAVHLTLWLFSRFFDRASGRWLYLSSASYSVYLFHHVLVIALAILMLRVDLPAIVKFGVLCATSFSGALLVHEFLVRRSPILMFLFNGRRQADRAPEGKPGHHGASA